MDLVKDFGAIAGGSPEKIRKVNLFQTERFFADVYVIVPGQEQAAHAHAGSDKVYAVLAGSGFAHVDGARIPVRAGQAVLCPAGSSHAIENVGFEEMRVLVFMAPHPSPGSVAKAPPAP
jgi:mannose-6-phosphate isomerase-like protein (cupin superfamily)